MKSITTSFIAFAVTLVCANVLAQGVKVPRTPSPAAKVSRQLVSPPSALVILVRL